MSTLIRHQAWLWGLVALAIGVLMWALRPVLTPFLLGALIAYMLQPGVEWLARHRVPRWLAALAMILCFAAMAALLVTLMFAVVQTEGPQLQAKIPVLLANLNAWLQPKLAVVGLGVDLDLTHLRDLLAGPSHGGEGASAVAIWQYLRTSGHAMLTVVGNVVLVPLVLFYLLYDRHQMFRRMESLVPRRWLATTRAFVIDIDRMLSQYLRGQLLVMVVLAAFYPIALALAGFDIALPLGLFTGLAVFIPYVGFAAGLALAVLAAVLQFGDLYGLGAVAVVYGLGQILENVFLTPRLIGERIGLHPLAVIFALLAFGHLFGFFGVLLALPASAILAAALRELRRRYLASDLYQA
ncbi:AI-2E family transporter [Ralstonia pickettii]|uniref:AI-2E family transporter n=1 Tax=Ralstonia pickettii TaxID=329 RepID=A0A2N4TRK8_RALPI|nr:AI-2E family transporter [Ralstonia pickettii]